MIVPRGSIDLDVLNAASRADFVAALSGVAERSPWVVGAAAARRPFASVEALCAALEDAVRDADDERRLALIRAHPELGGAEAQAGVMTSESDAEQGRLGLLALDVEDGARLARLNAAYRRRFGFPFMIALDTVFDLDAVFDAFERRLRDTRKAEVEAAIDQICAVMRRRAHHLVAGGRAA